jgi:NAD(P)-dependent dehydrogenase (short-subunit alcohol dehydrogenase family)
MRNFQDLDENVEESDWDTCFNFNVKSHLFLFHAVKPHLEKSEGSFLTTASLSGITPGGSSLVGCSLYITWVYFTIFGSEMLMFAARHIQ